MSNLAEKNPRLPQTISHNQAMLSGPNLNRKITTAILKLRFDKYLLCFDLKKAFLTIAITPVNQSKLLFLWYKNVTKNDFSIVAYKNLRLPFGLRCSPTLLMLGLYKILILDAENEEQDERKMKRIIYDLLYMDNGCVTANTLKELRKCPQLLEQTFSPYQFALQQCVTNDSELQLQLDEKSQQVTADEVKLLGLRYNRKSDTLSTAQLHLEAAANTKRKILSTIASNFDLFNFAGPLLNRARLFMHRLQCAQDVGWDEIISESQIREWRCIAKQVSDKVPISIERFIGARNGKYSLVAFTDASKVMLGVVVYIRDIATGKLNFVLAKNRIIGRQLETKSIPSLELCAISFGVEILMDVYNELHSESSAVPVDITNLQLYADSLVALSWINKYVNKLDKMQKCSVFVMNRLESISRMCSVNAVTFQFVSGLENPADVITRPISYKQLLKTNFHSGPQNLNSERGPQPDEGICFRVPNPSSQSDTAAQLCVEATAVKNTDCESLGKILNFHRYSSFQILVRAYRNAIKYVRLLKNKITKVSGNCCELNSVTSSNSFVSASINILRAAQRDAFSSVFEYFDNRLPVKCMPNIVGQLNIFKDENGLLRVRSKFKEWHVNFNREFPILLPNNGPIVQMIVNDCHHRMAHAGCYSVLGQLRNQFHIPRSFATVKKILNECVVCRKQNARTIKLNQSFYRDFRENPTNIPYRDIFVDHYGPYFVNNGSKKVKVWILCITCLWSRAINLKMCCDLTVTEFLRTFQLHIFEYGMPERVFSDLGTQLVAGANIVIDWLKDVATQLFFNENNIKSPTFKQFFKGHKPLGSLVETCVKLTKRLLYGAIGKNVLHVLQFELFVAQTVNIVNKRPIAFKEILRVDVGNDQEVPTPITPELLLKGYELTTVSVIPRNYSEVEWKPGNDPVEELKNSYEKLEKARQKLIEIYHEEFLPSLMYQAINKKDRFKPVSHKALQIGDIVLLKEENTKRINFPLGIVKKIICNDLGEITDAEVKKGKTGETLKRHVTSLIPILSSDQSSIQLRDGEDETVQPRLSNKRKAAMASSERTKVLFDNSSA